MVDKKKKKSKKKSPKVKIDLMAGVPRPKPVKFTGPGQILEQAREHPWLGFWIMEGWRDVGLAPVVAARQQTEGRVTYAVFLVDYYCLGVKNVVWKAVSGLRQFQQDLPSLCSGTPEPIDASLAHELIYGSIEYARRYGFEPHLDFKKAGLILDPPEMHPRKNKVKFGKDGKPLFIAGPYDHARRIVNTLMRTAGEGNFDYILSLPGPDDF